MFFPHAESFIPRTEILNRARKVEKHMRGIGWWRAFHIFGILEQLEGGSVLC